MPCRLSLVLFLALIAPADAVAQAPSAAQVHAALRGRWVGTLGYKDYRRPDRRVTLPTTIEGTSAPGGGVALHFIYDDGPGKTVVDDDVFMLAADRRTLRWSGVKDTVPATFRVLSLERTNAQGLRLVVEREGEDDNAPATLRETITIRGDTLGILKEVRPAGSPFSFRHQYALTRR